MEDGHIYEAMEPSMESERFLLTSKPHPNHILKKGFPLDSLSIDIKSGKYFYFFPFLSIYLCWDFLNTQTFL